MPSRLLLHQASSRKEIPSTMGLVWLLVGFFWDDQGVYDDRLIGQGD